MHYFNLKVYLCCAILSKYEWCIARGFANANVPSSYDPFIGELSTTELFSSAMPLINPGKEEAVEKSRSTTICSSPSTRWLQEQVRNVSDEDLSNFFDWHVYSLSFAYKLLVHQNEQSSGQEYFGVYGEYTPEINYIREQTQEFWSESGVYDIIRVLGAHGSDLKDTENNLIPTLEVLFSKSYTDKYTVFDHANDIQDLISRLPGGYDYPLLTFNAFATDKVDRNHSPSIIIGDGYFEFQKAVGLGSEGPEYALSHEHAHHLQFTLFRLPEESSNSTRNARRQELMADAFSAYFLAHKSGGEMAADELSNIHEIAFSVGDCEVDSDVRHHGTPRQRRCATRWGASVASSKDSTNLDLVGLKDRFETWYERMDATESLDDFCEYDIASAASCKNRISGILQMSILLFGGVVVLFGI